MATFQWSAEGGNDGVQVTTGAVAAGDTTPSTVTVGSGGVLAFNATHFAHGALGVATSMGATAASAFLGFNTTGWGLTQYFRMYVYLPSAASGTQIDLIQSRDTANRFRLRITPSNKVAVINGTSNVGQSTASITFDAWVRVEMKVVVDASAGSMEARFCGRIESVADVG